MRETLKNFFPDQLEKQEVIECIISKRLPAFKIAAISEAEASAIRRAAIRKAKLEGRKDDIDSEANMLGMVIACVKHPDLHDAQLQAAWGIMGAEGLVQKMLLPGEYAELTNKVASICGFDNTMQELVDKAKN